MLERKYYRAVQNFLEKNSYTVYTYNNKGKQEYFIDTGVGQVRMDVFGIRIPSKDIVNRDIEIVAVEVKRKAKGDLPLHYFYQSLSYSKLAHRCYLACPKQSFSEKDKINATDLGVGLLKIKDKTAEIITYPRRMTPSLEQIKELLHRLHIVQCSLCGSFVYRYEKGIEAKGSWRDQVFCYDYKKNMILEKKVYFCKKCFSQFNVKRRARTET